MNEYEAQELIKAQGFRVLVCSGTGCMANGSAEIIKKFGKEVLNDDGTVNTSALSAMVFSDAQKLKKLNNIIHPAVLDKTMDIVDENEGLIIIETALPDAARLNEYCDEIWYVYVPAELRISRLLDNRGGSAQKWKSIIDNQCTEKEFQALADRIIDNSGSLAQMEQQIKNNIEQLI